MPESKAVLVLFECNTHAVTLMRMFAL